MSKKKKKSDRPSDEDLNKLSHEEFVEWFVTYNRPVIDRYIFKRLIPNRYESADIRAYMAERMLDILGKRSAKGNPIKNPRTYFGRLIDYWCIEYQRMHGFIYGLPKRPRPKDKIYEKEISQYGFVYLESEGETCDTYNSTELSYIDENITTNLSNFSNLKCKIKEEDAGEESKEWNTLMKMVLPEDKLVLECIFARNMSTPDIARYLGLATVTVYLRRDRGLGAISGYISSYTGDNPKMSLKDILSLTPSSLDITDIFSLAQKV